jgi:hypothetical protein|tara:strand:- start:313 stop:585 length:273 start_codon:yes stop_codon:yes gene_type:complete
MDNKIFFCSRNGKSEITDMITSYVRSTNGKKIIIFNGKRDSFRCRQRSRKMDGGKIDPLKFVSFKVTQKELIKNQNKLIGPLTFDTRSRL